MDAAPVDASTTKEARSAVMVVSSPRAPHASVTKDVVHTTTIH